ncbi:MAG: bifunctional folylpolyglutamate synthase/dihydrofolate synthase [Alphaproteobacteria bacterium]|nr:bifunctional folylpolyglutamate synthase/dihydrofolate synthase [Alphaproteobacteria bacterium]
MRKSPVTTRVDTFLKQLEHPKLAEISLGLTRIHALLEALGNPHHRLPPVVHVAGTNGKGSLIAFLRAMLEASGKRVHVYSSPHLVRFNERIVLAGYEIADEELEEILATVHKAVERIPCTFFEATTAAAFLAFAAHPADFLLLETGLGGRLDATNVIDTPVLTALTPISYDHMEYLGESLAQIATEKAGILKAGVPCVVGPQTPEAMRVIVERMQALGCRGHVYGKDWDVDVTFELALKGSHQRINASAAVMCARLLLPSITEAAIVSGLKNAYWPARMQRLTRGALVEALPKGVELWLDGGHNAAGAEVIAAEVERWGLSTYLICGMRSDKEARAFLSHFAGKITEVKAVAIAGNAHGMPPERLAETAHSLGMVAKVADSPLAAVQQVAREAHGPYRVLICGSLYLAGNILADNT